MARNPVSRSVLHGITDRFQQWLKAWSAKRIIPVIEAPKGRRNEFVEPRGAAPDAVVAVLKAREPTAMVDADTAVFSMDSTKGFVLPKRRACFY